MGKTQEVPMHKAVSETAVAATVHKWLVLDDMIQHMPPQ